MSYADYWDGDPEIAKHYRAKHKAEQEQRNYELWLQGGYIYEALLDASPVLNALAKDHTAIPYRSEPFPLSEAEAEQRKQRENEKKMAAAREIMMAKMTSINSKFGKKEQAENG